MIVVNRVIFEFVMGDEQFAFKLYDRWDDFCRQGFVEVADRLLSERDNLDTVLCIDRLSLDLGMLTEGEFYGEFQGRVAERMREALQGISEGTERNGIKRLPVSQEYDRQLMHYLLYGYTLWRDGDTAFDLKRQMEHTLREEAERFMEFLLAEGKRETLRRRLIFRLEDEMLQALVSLTVSADAIFIRRYTEFQLRSYHQLYRCRVTQRDYRDALWMLLLTYLWAENHGFVSRKELVRYTIRGLAAHLGISVWVLIGYLTQGIEELLARDTIGHELSDILEAIRYEEKVENTAEISVGNSRKISESLPEGLLKKIFTSGKERKKGGGRPEQEMKELRRLLADAGKRRKILGGLREEEIELLIKAVVLGDSDFIVSYARILEGEKEKGMYEGKAGGEFRLVKWEFIFSVLVEKSFGNLDRKQFVADVLRRLAAHYGLDYVALVEYFKCQLEELPGWLIGILGALSEEEQPVDIEMIKYSPEKMTEGEERWVLEILRHPVSCRRFLNRLEEAEIIGLVKKILPHDREFVLEYAEHLTMAKEKGMFDGHAGNEFSRLKWEFIFQLALTNAFNRKYFALGVLRQLSAHYAINVNELLDYFYRYLEDTREGGMSGIRQTIRELWMEAKAGQVVQDTELHVANELDEKLAVLERYLLTGVPQSGYRDIYALFLDLKARIPEKLRGQIKRIPAGWLADINEQDDKDIPFYMALLSWWLEDSPGNRQELVDLEGMIQLVLRGGRQVDIRELRLLLACCLEGRVDDYRQVLEGKERIGSRMAVVHFPALQILLADFRREEVALFLRNKQEELRQLLFSSTFESRQFVGYLRKKARYDGELAIFLKEILGEEFPEDDKVLPFPEEVTPERLRQHLSFGQRDRKWIEKWRGDRRYGLQVIKAAEGDRILQRKWLEQAGNMSLQKLATEWLELEKKMRTSWNGNKVWSLLMKYSLPEYANLALEELYLVFIRELSEKLSRAQMEKLDGIVMKGSGSLGLWKKCWQRLRYVPKHKVSDIGKGRGNGKMMAAQEEAVWIEVRNAGLVLFAPWFPQLFRRLGLLDEEEFTDREAQIKAVFILQALVDGTEEKEYGENELFLNRLLVGMPVEEALPLQMVLTAVEKETVGSLVENLRASWPKMKNTSVEGLRHSFLQREGIIEEQEQEWKLTVQPAGMDILLDALPWGFSMVKLPWMQKMLTVEWKY